MWIPREGSIVLSAAGLILDPAAGFLPTNPTKHSLAASVRSLAQKSGSQVAVAWHIGVPSPSRGDGAAATSDGLSTDGTDPTNFFALLAYLRFGLGLGWVPRGGREVPTKPDEPWASRKTTQEVRCERG